MKPSCSVDGVVFIAEEFDDDFHMRSGLFHAHWESDDGGRFVNGPRGVPVGEAIAWGRAHADVVLVLVDDDPDHLSAGVRHPGEGLATWPEGRTVQRRREPGMEHLDIEADQPIRWEARLARALPAEGFDDHVRRVRDALAAQSPVHELRVEGGDRPFDAVFRFTVLARTHAEAMALVVDADWRTRCAAPSAVEGRVLETGAVVDEWSPYHDIRPVS
jgi:hypothetical protein